MTHLAYIIPSYALALAVIAWLGIGAWRRTAVARRKLAALDPRATREWATRE